LADFIQRIRPILALVIVVGLVVVWLISLFPGKAPYNPHGRKEMWWKARHYQYRAEAANRPINILFLGDSITDNWRIAGKPIWDVEYAPLQAANFGMQGDQTEQLLWRVEHGELRNMSPQLVVILIGTNNIRNGDKPEDIVRGISRIVDTVGKKLRRSKILLLGILPREASPSSRLRTKVKEVNERIARLDNGSSIRFLDIGQHFLNPDGTLKTELMPDGLHPGTEGYRVFADALRPTFIELVGAPVRSQWDLPCPRLKLMCAIPQ
jgi:beta-glucosidase